MMGFFESQIGSASLPDTRVREVGDGTKTRSADGTALALADAVLPDWTRAAVWENDLCVVTEVPATLTKSVDYTVLVERSGRQVSFTTQEPNVRVLIVEPLAGGGDGDAADDADGSDGKNNGDGEVYCMLATFLPDGDWGGDARELAIGGSTGDFSGLLIYSLHDGTSAWGLRYEDGKTDHIVVFDAEYADLQDPDFRISMGTSARSLTRSIAHFYIEEVYCIDQEMKMGSGGGSDGFCPEPFGPRDWPAYIIPEPWYGFGGSSGIGSNIGLGFDDNGVPIQHYVDDDDYTMLEPITVRAPKASKIFNGSSLSFAEWIQLEAMLDKITFPCMGHNLYIALADSRLNFVFKPNPVNGPKEDSYYNPSTKTMTLTSLSDYGVLTQELFHVYQFKQAGGEIPKTKESNIEVEAHLAQYLLLYKNPPEHYSGTDVWNAHQNNEVNSAISYISNFIDDKCQIQSGYEPFFEDAFLKAVKSYSTKTGSLMSTERSDLNIKNLQDISKNC